MQLNAKPNNGFHFREIRPQAGIQLTNPNLDFMDFLLYCSIGKSERGFAKNYTLLDSGLLFANYACGCKTPVPKKPKNSFS